MIAQHSSATVEHYTPKEIVEASREVLGCIDLDPASSELAQRTVKAKCWYGKDSPHGWDGLRHQWYGNVFLNPPGGTFDRKVFPWKTKSRAAAWWAYLEHQWRIDHARAAIFVGFTLEIMRSAQSMKSERTVGGVKRRTLSPMSFPFCVPEKRIAFDTINRLREGGKRKGELIDPSKPVGARVKGGSSTNANVIVFLPASGLWSSDEPEVEAFADVFTEFGEVRL